MEAKQDLTGEITEVPKTPDIHRIRVFGEDISYDISRLEDPLSPQLALRIEKLIKGTNTLVGLHQQLLDDLHNTEAAQYARHARESRGQRRVTGGGVMTVAGARHRINDRAVAEARTRLKRAQKDVDRHIQGVRVKQGPAVPLE
jgi:hypothetical protein